jgi:lipopolysaccharide biosynthesis glycosyltransferase
MRRNAIKILSYSIQKATRQFFLHPSSIFAQFIHALISIKQKLIKKFFHFKKRLIINKKAKIYSILMLCKLQQEKIASINYENSDDIIHIAMASDNKYSRYLVTAVASIILSSNDIFYIYIIDDGISTDYKDYIHRLSLKYKNFIYKFICLDKVERDEISRFACRGWAPSVYYRAKLPNILRNIDKILYLDTDIICLTSIRELYETNLEEKGIGACIDTIDYMKSEFHHLKQIGFNTDINYINSGVLLMNLEKMRNMNFESLFVSTCHKFSTCNMFADQDIFNVIFQYDKLLLPQKWNFQAPMYRFPYNKINFKIDPAIIHYTTSNKPWLKDSKCYFKKLYTEFENALYTSLE